jgi:hypothetical protein
MTGARGRSTRAYNITSKVGWKVNGSGTSWSYKNAGNPVPLVNGIQKMQLKKLWSPPGKFKFGVKGKNGNSPVNGANLPIVGTIVIECRMRPWASGNYCLYLTEQPYGLVSATRTALPAVTSSSASAT